MRELFRGEKKRSLDYVGYVKKWTDASYNLAVGSS